jgi:ketosteroid isomerase-like protein
MRRLSLAVAFVVATVASSPAVAADDKDVMATINQFINGFNTGDIKSALATCNDSAIIIDDFPPHEWHGSGACATWAHDYGVDAKNLGITDGIVKLHKPWHVDVTGDRAYAVIPSDYTYKLKGKPVKEANSVITFAMQKVGGAWKVAGWSWSKH